MFIEKLSKMDCIILLQKIRQEFSPSETFCVFDKKEFNEIVENKKLRDEMARNYYRIYIANKDSIFLIDSNLVVFDDDRNYLHFAAQTIKLLNKKSNKEFLSYTHLYISDFELIYDNEKYNKKGIEKIFYEFMYEKFGEDYLTALKNYYKELGLKKAKEIVKTKEL